MQRPPAPVELHVASRGAGPPVVLLHGFPFDHSMWRETAEALADAGWRAIQPDLRGHGKSPVAQEATMQAMAADVAAWLEANQVHPAIVVGFSMGGYVALQLALRHLDRVKALVLCDTRAEADTAEARAGRAKTAQAVRGHGMAALVESMLPKLLHPATEARDPSVAQRIEAMMRANPPAGAVAALEGMAQRPDVRPKLHLLRMPCLVLVGEADAVTPIEAAQALAQGLAGSELEVVRKAGHMVPLEQPEEFQRLLLGWLKRLG